MSANQNATKLRPLFDSLLSIYPENDRQAVEAWYDELIRVSVDPNQLNQNQVLDLETDLSTVTTTVTTVSDTSDTHIAATNAHGANGNIIGAGDVATLTAAGVVKMGAAVTNATTSTVSVDSADASDLATAITLVNETKADVNTLVTNLNSAITQLNALLASIRTSGTLGT